MKTLLLFTPLFATLTVLAQTAGADVRRSPSAERSGAAVWVRVPDGPLVLTGQISAPAGGDARTEVERALQALAATLSKVGTDLARVVRLNAYVADDAHTAAVEAAIAARFPTGGPAVSIVFSPLSAAGARVAFDAVATTARVSSGVDFVDPHVAVLPAGGKVFISGQAERGTDVASAVKLTMAGLHRSLAHVGLKKSDVVQVKAFIKPFADHAAATREIAASFGGGPVPPIVLMEWVSELYAEIELVAAAPGMTAPAGETVTYSWLPWLTKSPRYCHVAFVPAGTPLIFIGGVNGGDRNDPRTQMKTIFERLGSLLFEAGSSYRNMVKATYYLADPAARSLLGDIRGVYYDPTRPPAASALNMRSMGHAGRAAMIDMIAVPVK